MIFFYIKDQDKVRIQHDNYVLVFLALLGSSTTEECKTRSAFYTYVQRKLENRSTVADAITKEEISPQLYGSHKDFRINAFPVNIKVGVYFNFIFFVSRFGAIYVVFLSSGVKRTFYDLNGLNVSLEVMVKLTRRAWGKFVTLNKVKTPRLIT